MVVDVSVSGRMGCLGSNDAKQGGPVLGYVNDG